MVQVILTSGTTYTIPSGWNSGNNTIEAIGGGGGGHTALAGSQNGPGGGGGEYRKISNLAANSGDSITYAIGAGGAANTDGGNTQFKNASTLQAIGGSRGGNGLSGGAGGTGGDW